MLNMEFCNELLIGGIITVLILLTFLVSPILNKRYNITWRLNVWKTFMVFLIVPIGLMLRMVILNKNIQIGMTIIKNNINTPPSPAKQAVYQTLAENHTTSLWTKLMTESTELIAIIWMIGIFITALYFLIVYFSFRYNIKKNNHLIYTETFQKIIVKCKLKLKMKKNIKFYHCDKISSPMIVGMIKPMILIPNRDYTLEDLEFIITHELTHYIRKDLLYKGLFLLVLVLHWYNPIIHKMVQAANRDIELCCDQDVLKDANKRLRLNYSNMIMNEIVNCEHINSILFAYMGCNKKAMEDRFKNIFNKKKNRCCFYLVSILFLAIIASGFVFAADRDAPNFNDSQYQWLLEKAITDKQIQDKAQMEKKSLPFLATSDFQNDNSDLSEFESFMSVVNHCIGPHVLGNGDWAVYSTNSGEPWKLKKGDIVKVHIYLDMDRFVPTSPANRNFKKILKFGYVKDSDSKEDTTDLLEKGVDLLTIEDKKEVSLDFKVPQDGNYNFYLFCPSSYEIIVKWLTIEVN